MLVQKERVTRVLHPSEEGAWVDIRALTGAEMDEAADVSVRKALMQFEASLETLMKASRERAENASPQVRKDSYDPEVLLNAAIVAWSEEVPVTPQSVALLDGPTRDWLWQEVVDRNTRPPK